jgi:hypothetical protein
LGRAGQRPASLIPARAARVRLVSPTCGTRLSVAVFHFPFFFLPTPAGFFFPFLNRSDSIFESPSFP